MLKAYCTYTLLGAVKIMILFLITWVLFGIFFMFLTSYLILRTFSRKDVIECLILGAIGGYIAAIVCFINIVGMFFDGDI